MEECLVFVVDVDPEIAQEAGVQGSTRLDIIRSSICMFVHAKARVNPKHKFALAALKDEAQLLWGPSSSVDGLLAALTALAPSPTPTASCDLSHLATLGAQMDYAMGCGSSCGHSSVRVVLMYSRSRQVPRCTNRALGVALDILYVHESPQPGVNCPQEVFSVLEEEGEALSRAVGHHAYIFESSCTNVRKWLGLMVWLLAHPKQRLAQQELIMTRALVDLAAPSTTHSAPHPPPTSALAPPPPGASYSSGSS